MNSTDSVEKVLDDNGIQHRDKGKDYLVPCLNPAHEDATPSLFVHKETGKFNCFSCGFKGNIFRHFGVFVSPIKGLVYDIRQKVLRLQSQARGLEVPSSAAPFEEDFRGISAQSYIDHRAFIDSTPEYEGRVLFPITDSTGKIVLFNGRNIHSKVPPKYKYFPHGVSLPVYPSVVGTPYLILVEGMLDYLNMYDKGTMNVATCFGTNSLTDNTVEEKLSFQVLSGVSTIVLLFDNDRAGREAANKISKSIETKLHTRVVIANHLLPDNGDPGALNKMEVSILEKKVKKLIDY